MYITEVIDMRLRLEKQYMVLMKLNVQQVQIS